ncbi:MAG: hypothetical protein U0105_23790 [Candidatus Obscuribacterales bacterium]
MAVLDVKKQNLDDIRSDIVDAVKEEFDMDVHSFLVALQSGQLSKDNDAVRDILLWLKFIPTDDPILQPCH